MKDIFYHQPQLQKIALSICKDLQAAEDIVQDTFLDALERGITGELELKNKCKEIAFRWKNAEDKNLAKPAKGLDGFDPVSYAETKQINAGGRPEPFLKEENEVPKSLPLHTKGKINLSANGFLPFSEARAFVRDLGLHSQREWNAYSKTKRPRYIPSNPQHTYKDKAG